MTKNKELQKQKEITKLEKASRKPATKYYFIIFLIIVTLVYAIDEITSNINAAQNPDVIRFFYNIIGSSVDSPEYNAANGEFFLYSMLLYVTILFAPFYKSFADKWGRKIFLCVNTILMGFGMFICMIAPNLLIFLAGSALMLFTTPNDFHVLYIMEVAPEKHRNTVASVTKGLGLLSVSLVGVFRLIFMKDGSGIEAWRNVYFIPIIMAFVIGGLSFVLMNETPTFINKRLALLKGEETKEEKVKEQPKEKVQGGVINAIKYIFKNKQLKWIFIACLLYAFGCGATNYYSNVFNGMVDSSGKVDMLAVNIAITAFPFANALITSFGGLISDRLGRKRTVLILGSLAALCMIGYVVAAKLNLGGIAVGIIYGCFIGCLYSASDILFLVLPSESTPTGLRASVVGTMSFMLFAGTAVSWVIVIVSQMFLVDWGLASLMTIPFLALAIVITLFKVKETKGIDLDTL